MTSLIESGTVDLRQPFEVANAKSQEPAAPKRDFMDLILSISKSISAANHSSSKGSYLEAAYMQYKADWNLILNTHTACYSKAPQELKQRNEGFKSGHRGSDPSGNSYWSSRTSGSCIKVPSPFCHQFKLPQCLKIHQARSKLYASMFPAEPSCRMNAYNFHNSLLLVLGHITTYPDCSYLTSSDLAGFVEWGIMLQSLVSCVYINHHYHEETSHGSSPAENFQNLYYLRDLLRSSEFVKKVFDLDEQASMEVEKSLKMESSHFLNSPHTTWRAIRTLSLAFRNVVNLQDTELFCCYTKV